MGGIYVLHFIVIKSGSSKNTFMVNLSKIRETSATFHFHRVDKKLRRDEVTLAVPLDHKE